MTLVYATCRAERLAAIAAPVVKVDGSVTTRMWRDPPGGTNTRVPSAQINGWIG